MSPIYGIEAASSADLPKPPHVPPTPGAAWSIAPVVFNAAQLVMPSLVGPDDTVFSFAGWYKTAWDSETNGGGFAWVTDPSGLYGTWLAGFFGAGSPALTPNMSDADGNYAQSLIGPYHTSWQHIMGSFVTDPVNDPLMVAYVDDQNESAIAASNLSGSGWPLGAIAVSGLPFWFGSDGQGNDYVGEMADVSIWPGVDFTGDHGLSGTIPDATRRLFITADFKPVNPTQAILTFDSPSILLTGDKDHIGLNTYGRGGALTLQAGTLANGAYAPGVRTPGFVSYGALTASTFSPPLPQFYDVGNLLLAVLRNSFSGDTLSVSAPWTLGESFNDASGHTMAWAWCYYEPGIVAPVFHSANSANGQGQVFSFDGVDSHLPIGNFGHSFGVGTAFSKSGIVTTAPYSMALGIVWNNQATQSQPAVANYTAAIKATGGKFFPYYQIVPTTGSTSNTLAGTFSVAAQWMISLIEIEALL